MTSRLDFSDIRPLDSYAAKWCPVRTQLDVLEPVERAPVSPEMQLRFDEGNEFEAEIVARLAEVAGEGWVFVDETQSGGACRAATADAMAVQAPVIVGANLATDFEGKRAGKPDILVWESDGYVPVDIKHHLTLHTQDKESVALGSMLEDPRPSVAAAQDGQERRKHKTDALQLAHYWRMLESLGASASEPWGGIIGKEGVVVWYHLDEQMWSTPAKSDGKKRKLRTTLEVYDFEFGFRRDIAAAALASVDDGADLLVESMWCDECPSCSWVEYCEPQLREGSGDASLLPGVGYQSWRALRDAGIRGRDQVAELDLQTARLVSDNVDAVRWRKDAAEVGGETLVEDIRPRATAQVAKLKEAGIDTAQALLDVLDPMTATLGPFAADAIVNARAAVGPEPVYRLADGVVDVPRGDIELDVDMENTIDGVYQWGVLVTDRSGSGLVDEGYRPFVSWAPMTTVEEELRLFLEFWQWLTELRAGVTDSELTLRAYCWYEGAENTQMRRIAEPDADLAAAVEAFIESDEWVDMYAVFKGGWTTGESAGLKDIAPLAGHSWEVEDPGGGMSMVHHAAAVQGDEAARQWLLDYNRGDVEATKAIREWLGGRGASLPEVPESFSEKYRRY